MNKKAYYLSLDAFVALVVILGIVLVIQPPTNQIPPQSNTQNDLILALSSVKIGDLDNAYAQTLISDGNITNLNQTVLEQIGEFYAKSDPEANLLAQNILDELNPDNNVGLYFNGIEIATIGTTPMASATDIWTSRQIISGIQQGESATGFSSIATLSAANKVDYFYFGGYIGDGNITVRLDGDISNVEIEAVFSGPFDIYINDQFAGFHNPTLNTPYNFDLSSHLSKFVSGTNLLEFKGIEDKLAITGGFIKTSFDETQSLTQTTKKYFSGIEGLINIYDNFFIPGELNSLEVYLHYNSEEDIFLTIGNKTLFTGNSAGLDDIVTLPNVLLDSALDYDVLTQKTIPIRLGLENASFVFNETQISDVFSVTDLSGSMDQCALNCGGGGGDPIKIIDLASDANRNFIEIILNVSDNKVGIVGYESEAKDEDYHPLSRDNVSLNAEIDSWKPGGGTGICAGINRATNSLLSESSPNKSRSMVVMSDGKANVKCPEQNTGNAAQDAIQAACTAFNDYGIKVYAVGFGPGVDETTLQAIASCGGGSYYFSDVDSLKETYGEIAQEVIQASFVEQTIISSDIHSLLYPDSYVEIQFNKTLPSGLVINSETPAFSPLTQGIINIPDDAEAYQVGVISYSGSRWTHGVEVFNNVTSDWESVFNLSEYNLDFIKIGDPFIVNIPLNKLVKGNNSIRVFTALRDDDAIDGSTENKIIYTLVKDTVSFSPIVSSASGCTWTLEFEDLTTTVINVPSTYTGSEQCSYTSTSIAYNNNDAIDLAIFRLLEKIDLDSDGKLETKFSQNDLTLDSTQVEGIPFTWDTEVQVRVWR